MKRIRPIVIALIVMIMLSATMVACTDNPPTPATLVEVKFVIGDQQHTVSTDKLYVNLVLEELAADKGLHLVTETSNYGPFVKEIGNLKPDVTKEFLAFYSTLDDIKYSDPLYTTVVDGVTYYSCNFGISTMPIIANTTYLFQIVAF